MASRNTIRHYDIDAYYHIYNRGVGKQAIFRDDDDRAYFLYLLKRHLDSVEHKDNSGRVYTRYPEVELIAFCLMDNHFHLFIYQHDDAMAFTKLLRSVSTAYTMYFNKKYDRVGHLFQDRFKASRIDSDAYLLHITRYIHLNPSSPFTYEWSSLPYYLGRFRADWVRPGRAMELFEYNTKKYELFLREGGHNLESEDVFSELLADR